jgi:REP element-mobilizing transposase RayT
MPKFFIKIAFIKRKYMSTGYQIQAQDKLHYITMQVVYWIDIFTRQRYRDIVLDSLRYCQKEKGLEIFAYVIMSNHVHLIVRSSEDNLSQTVGDLKKFTSKQIIKSIETEPESRREWLLWMFKHAAEKHKRNKNYQFWTHENHAVLLYSEEFIKERLLYIHDNPVRAGIVEHPEDYLYSSARNYASLESVLEIDLLSFKWKTYS